MQVRIIARPLLATCGIGGICTAAAHVARMAAKWWIGRGRGYTCKSHVESPLHVSPKSWCRVEARAIPRAKGCTLSDVSISSSTEEQDCDSTHAIPLHASYSTSNESAPYLSGCRLSTPLVPSQSSHPKEVQSSFDTVCLCPMCVGFVAMGWVDLCPNLICPAWAASRSRSTTGSGVHLLCITPSLKKTLAQSLIVALLACSMWSLRSLAPSPALLWTGFRSIKVPSRQQWSFGIDPLTVATVTVDSPDLDTDEEARVAG
jgi:hypothetical protein